LRSGSLLFLSRRKRRNRSHARDARVESEIVGQPLRLPIVHVAGGAPALQFFHVSAAFERADAALLRVRDKTKKFSGRGAKFHRGCFLQRLRDIQPAVVKQFKRNLDFVSISRAEASAPQTDHIQAEDIVDFSRDYERIQTRPG
jgi:hypothetical protein